MQLSVFVVKVSRPNGTQSFYLKIHRSNNTEHTRKDFNFSCILFLAQWVKNLWIFCCSILEI